METDKPLSGALKVAHNLSHCPTKPCAFCNDLARVIARECGLAELVEAVAEMERADFSNLRERSTASLVALMDAQRKVIAAARRVRGES